MPVHLFGLPADMDKINQLCKQHNLKLFEDSCAEAFCSGTAAVITPIASVSLEGQKRIFNNSEPGEFTKKIYKLLTGIQYLDIEDEFGWITKV